MASGGYIKIDRKLLDWRFAQHPSAVALWIHLLLKANWQNGYFHGREIPRGSLATSVRTLNEDTGLGEKTIRRWLEKLEESGEIKTDATNKYTVITILKYNEYQGTTDDEMGQLLTKQVTKQLTKQLTNQVTKQVTNDRRIKERKNIRREEYNARETASPDASSSSSEKMEEEEALKASLLKQLKETTK